MKDDRYGEKWKRSCIRIIIDDGIDINIQKRNIRDFLWNDGRTDWKYTQWFLMKI